MTFIILLIIGALLRACWHISKFRPQMSWIPIWDYPFGIKRPPLDAFHVYGGLFALWMIFVILLQPNWILFAFTDYWLLITVHLVLYWVVFFYFFSAFYHVILMKPGYRQWEYLIPIIKKN